MAVVCFLASCVAGYAAWDPSTFVEAGYAKENVVTIAVILALVLFYLACKLNSFSPSNTAAVFSVFPLLTLWSVNWDFRFFLNPDNIGGMLIGEIIIVGVWTWITARGEAEANE